MEILIPCKGFAEAKSRLAARLGAEQRRRVTRWLLEHALDQAVALCSSAHVHLITGDPEAAALGRARGVDLVPDPDADLNAAVARGRDAVAARPGPLVILPIDLPLATAEAIGAAAELNAEVAIAPDLRRDGTNLLCLSGEARRRFAFAYGPGSFAAHRAQAETIGAPLRIVEDRRLAFDIDSPDDFDAWAAMQEYPWPAPR